MNGIALRETLASVLSQHASYTWVNEAPDGSTKCIVIQEIPSEPVSTKSGVIGSVDTQNINVFANVLADAHSIYIDVFNAAKAQLFALGYTFNSYAPPEFNTELNMYTAQVSVGSFTYF